MTIDVERESQALHQRSADLVAQLDAGHPVVEPIPGVWAERRRLAAATHQARREVAAKVAAGLDPGCVVGPSAPIRHVKTDPRTGHDLDPLHGQSVVTDALVAYWEWQRDTLAPAIEAQYRMAAEKTPHRPSLVAAARQHIGVLQQRATMLTEGGVDVEAAATRYDGAYERLRMGALDAQAIAGEAMTRLRALRRITAEAELGDDFDERPFIAAALSATTDLPINADTLAPLVVADSGK
jgi:hypothetical protein